MIESGVGLRDQRPTLIDLCGALPRVLRGLSDGRAESAVGIDRFGQPATALLVILAALEGAATQEAVQQSASVRSGSSAEFRMDRADTAALLADTEFVLATDP